MPLKCSNNNAFATLKCLKNASMNHEENPAPWETSLKVNY